MPLNEKNDTGREMLRLVSYYSADINDFFLHGTRLSDLPFPTYYNYVKNIPYKRDYEGIEVVLRPRHILNFPGLGADCKKKAILIGSWLKENHIPFDFLAVSRKPDGEFHHVIVQAETAEGPFEIDATYSHNQLNEIQSWTAAETLSGFSSGTWDGKPTIVSIDGLDDSEETKGKTLGIVWFIPVIISVVAGALSAGIQDKTKIEKEQAAIDTAQEMITDAEKKRAEQNIKNSAMVKTVAFAALGILGAVMFLK